uniref:Protoporphyrinogen oxidase n=1 Tax=Perkinsela sp. SMB-60 TaxID=1840652 RepID=A0A167HCZ3_9EUGL|nr:protoporphyrinogen oxidase [Perkinsela sp. SMB-60]
MKNEEKKQVKIVILGGGISGLSALRELQKTLDSKCIELTLIECEDSVGGKIQSIPHKMADGQTILYHDIGPHTFRTKGSGLTTLKTIVELGLADDLVSPVKGAFRRMIYHRGALRELTSCAVLWLVSWRLLMRKVFSYLLLGSYSAHIVQPVGSPSVHRFLMDNFGSKFARIVGKSMVRGIFAGDSHNVSVSDAFPAVLSMLNSAPSKMIEIFKTLAAVFCKSVGNLFKRRFTGSSPEQNSEILQSINCRVAVLAGRSSIYTLRNGMAVLPQTIYQQTKIDPRVNYVLSTKICGLYKCSSRKEKSSGQSQFLIKLDRAGESHEISADFVISAIPADKLLRILLGSRVRSQGDTNKFTHTSPVFGTAIKRCLSSISFRSVTVVNFHAEKKDLSLPEAFGYLTNEQQDPILGVIFDSSAFPKRYPEYLSVCTVMIRSQARSDTQFSEDRDWYIPYALKAIARVDKNSYTEPTLAYPSNSASYLQPDNVYEWVESIPQYTAGYVQRVAELRTLLQSENPSFVVCGSSYDGISVNDALLSGIIQGAHPIIEALER